MSVADVYGPGVERNIKARMHRPYSETDGLSLINVLSDKSKIFIVSRSGMLLNKSVANPSRGEKKYIGLGGKGRLTVQQIENVQGTIVLPFETIKL